jgi:hypothetical protein
LGYCKNIRNTILIGINSYSFPAIGTKKAPFWTNVREKWTLVAGCSTKYGDWDKNYAFRVNAIVRKIGGLLRINSFL